MYISDNDLKARILAGQIEILDDVLNECDEICKEALFDENPEIQHVMKSLKIKYSKRRTHLARYKRELETEK